MARSGDLGKTWLGIMDAIAEIICVGAAEGIASLGIRRSWAPGGGLGTDPLGINARMAEICVISLP
jgi:hypothetical protein